MILNRDITNKLFAWLILNNSNNYSNINSESIELFRSQYESTINVLDAFFGQKIRIENLSKLIEKLFQIKDPKLYCDFALDFVYDVKANHRINFVDEGLRNFCLNYPRPDNIIDYQSSFVSISPIQSPVDSGYSSDQSIKDELTTDHIAQCINQNTYYQSILRYPTKELKEAHYKELKHIIDKLQRLENQICINRLYLTGSVLPKKLEITHFPTPLYPNDYVYIYEYAEFVSEFQQRFLEFNIKYNLKTYDLYKQSLRQKVELMKTFDYNIDSHVRKLSKDVRDKYDKDFVKAVEKVNRLIEVKHQQKYKQSPQFNFEYSETVSPFQSLLRQPIYL
jgi:hypothetical protein